MGCQRHSFVKRTSHNTVTSYIFGHVEHRDGKSLRAELIEMLIRAQVDFDEQHPA
jgi:hypothetical protein